MKYLKWNLSFIFLTDFQFGSPKFKKKIVGLAIAFYWIDLKKKRAIFVGFKYMLKPFSLKPETVTAPFPEHFKLR